MGQAAETAADDITGSLEGIAEVAEETIGMLPEQIEEALKHLGLLIKTDLTEDFFDTRETVEDLHQEMRDLSKERIEAGIDLEVKRLEDLEAAKDHMKELGEVIQELGSISAEELATLDAEYNERMSSVQAKIEDVTAAWDEQTKRMIFDLAQQRLMQGGLTEEELTALSKLAGPEGLGLIDESAQRLIDAIGSSANKMEEAGDQSGLFVDDLLKLQTQIGNVEIAAINMNRELGKVPSSLEDMMLLSTTKDGIQKFQHGGSFIVGGQGGADSQTVSFR